MSGIEWSGRPGRIPNAPLRHALLEALEGDVTLSEVCFRMGWSKSDGKGANTAGLKRCLGIEATRYRNKPGGPYSESFVSSIDLGRATEICKAIGVDLDELYEGLSLVEKHVAVCDVCAAPMRQPDPEGICGLCREERELFGRVAVAA